MWNDDSFIRSRNNCYNYASDQRNKTYAQPGWASGLTSESNLTCPAVIQHAIAEL